MQGADCMKPEITYWIKEQAPSGNYYDSLGLPGRTREQAIAELNSWKAQNETAILVVRVEVQVA